METTDRDRAIQINANDMWEIPGRKDAFKIKKALSHTDESKRRLPCMHVDQVLLDQFTLCIFVYYIHNL